MSLESVTEFTGELSPCPDLDDQSSATFVDDDSDVWFRFDEAKLSGISFYKRFLFRGQELIGTHISAVQRKLPEFPLELDDTDVLREDGTVLRMYEHFESGLLINTDELNVVTSVAINDVTDVLDAEMD